MFKGHRAQSAVEPPILRRLYTRRAGFHIILRVEVPARRIRRTRRVHNGEFVFLEERRKGSERRMQPKKSVQVNGRISSNASWLRNSDGGAQAVIVGLREWHDDVESVSRPTLEQNDELLVPRRRRRSNGSPQKRRYGAQPGQGDSALFHEKPARKLRRPRPFATSVVHTNLSTWRHVRIWPSLSQTTHP